MPVLMLVFLVVLTGCDSRPPAGQPGATSESPQVADPTRTRERDRMVDTQLAGRDIKDKRVLDAMRRVQRHRFVPESRQAEAYDDNPLPIGEGQTISQPYIVAYMTQIIEPRPTDRVLEIGTGSGYQAAVLAELVKEVYTIEIVQVLGARAKTVLDELKYTNIRTRIGDGYAGWPDAAPFDKIVVTAAPDEVPQTLVDQLGENGIMVVPVGRGDQIMTVLRRTKDGVVRRETIPVRFVPMIKK
jgi:protein-L-isoaspartate(D-aspartate) O-methyltransferase